jgi:hypothetical protein
MRWRGVLSRVGRAKGPDRHFAAYPYHSAQALQRALLWFPLSVKPVSQYQSGLGGQKGCAPLWPFMPVDSATAYVRNGIASEADVRNGEPKAAGDRTAGNSYGAGGPGSAGWEVNQGRNYSLTNLVEVSHFG